MRWVTGAGNLVDGGGYTEERHSPTMLPNDIDTWPTAAGQVAPPTGGAGTNWTPGDTVTDIRFYNLGSSPANVGVSSQPANMQVQAAVILT